MTFFSLSAEKVLKQFNSTQDGLASDQIEVARKKFGWNDLKHEKKCNAFRILLTQFHSFIIYILIAAFAISLFLREYVDAVVIGVIIVLNAILGFVQEYKAEKSIEALKKLASPETIVMRNGRRVKIAAKELVPGDIVILEAGATVPADCYLLESASLQVDESRLTGESVPVNKEIGQLPDDTPLSERSNMLFSSTIVTTGRGRAIVVKTGMDTEIGKVADIIQKQKEGNTPLQKKLSKFGIKLGVIVIILSLIIFIAGLVVGHDVFEIFLVAVSLAVAAIPEGLPAVVTISLAIGVQRMVKRNVLIRKLSAVETLGSTTVICTDKTGTLTRNQMTVQKIHYAGRDISLSGKGYDIEGQFTSENQSVDPKDLRKIIEVGVVCNDASRDEDQFFGDPTEIALLVVGKKAGIYPQYERLSEEPFTSEKKFMTTVNQVENQKQLFIKGAPEIILAKCQYIETANGKQKLTESLRQEIIEKNEDMAGDALRMLGFAHSDTNSADELTFVGMMGMIDPPRKNVKQAVQMAKDAGIRPVMITGDHKITARAIGRKIGIEGAAMTGQEIDKLSAKDFASAVDTVSIYARVSPEHKVMILEALKKKDNIVAMTGDGVNDAPAIKKADIGVAVNSGTDVSKEAADMVLRDDNFSSIVSAVEEGRHIFNNIRKFIKYLLSCNLGEVMTIFFGVIFGLGTPLIAVQILWMNLVTDGLPALALSVEPAGSGVMKRSPRNPRESILNSRTIWEIVVVGITMTVITLFLFNRFSANMVYAQTIAFTSLVFLQLLNSLNSRSNASLFRVNFFRNWKLPAAIVVSFLLQMTVLYTPLGVFMKTMPLELNDLGLVALLSLVIIVVMEIFKLITQKLRKI